MARPSGWAAGHSQGRGKRVNCPGNGGFRAEAAAHLERGDLAHAEPREEAEHDREAVPLAVPVVGDDRQEALAFGARQNLGLLHPENLIQSGYPTENIIFSDVGEVDRKEKPKVSAGSSGNVRKYGIC